jgi:flagellar basal body P-ring formation protein FlgA
MKVNHLTVLLCTLCAPLLAASARAQADGSLQSLEVVRRVAESALRAQIDAALAGVELEAAALDARLRLPACARKPAASALPPRGGQSRALVRVSCAEGAAWSVNVPVEIRRRANVLVTRRAIARGETLNATDVHAQSRMLPGLVSPFVARVEDLAGRPARRLIPEGMALTADALSPAMLIRRGQNVTLTASGSGIEVRAPGLALADAAAHQRLRVQNLYSLKIVEGVADTDGVVRVNP